MDGHMTQIWIRGFLAIAIIAISGCATKGTNQVNYSPPVEKSIQNKITLDKNFDDVWDKLIANISASFFVINNIDKDSRLLNISMSSNKPEDFIECGSTDRTFNFQNKSENFNYKVAESSNFKYAGASYMNNGIALPAVYNVSRKTAMDGRINVYVAPMNNAKTTIAVNIRYVLTATTSGQAVTYDLLGNPLPQNQIIPKAEVTSTFNTSETSSDDWGTPGDPQIVQCMSNGNLESMLLEMAEK